MKTNALFKTIQLKFKPIFRAVPILLILIIFFFPGTALSLPPVNDNFTDAAMVTGSSGQISGSNNGASGEQGEPNHANVYDLISISSVWWKWEAPASGNVSFDTHGSDFDTVLGVYTGSDLNSLTEIEGNDDDGITNYLFSTVTFEAQSGTLYYIALGGYQGDTGDFVLNWTYPASSSNSPDAWEDDDSFDTASIIVLNHKAAQRHNFHDAGDGDWVKFYAVAVQTQYMIKVVHPIDTANIVIQLYDTDGTTLLRTADDYVKEQEENLSWYCTKEGIYYIKISDYSHDTFGEDTAYELSAYPEIGPLYGTIEGLVTDSITGKSIKNVKIRITDKASALSLDNGTYNMSSPPGNITLTAEVEKYKMYSADINMSEKGTVTHDITLTPESDKGDINQDGNLDLADAILGLQIITGTTGLPQKDYPQADVNQDSRIGLEDVIYILQNIGG